ncbi:uncharacterized protein PV09_04874 [Verruconis gallopava]|uniref:MARVEL domain-containing protein n=1 Tax=Verruconis gallopava TaxID=253628 RepID=A0A0D1XNA5_9PEZI|nr:uncharacterized protein PV09_04874 [Verruconis gallopava]KIW04056.1 hypothetical protein PV09_04874 [Verruconis gallopava]
MAFNYTLPLRVAQGVLTIIILGLTAYDVSIWSPSETNFLLFCSIWTILALAYLIVTPGRFPTAAHKYGILGAELVTMIFWFAGFIAEASLLGDTECHKGTLCRTMQAATVFGAFEWLLFAATSLMAGLHCWRTRNTHDDRADPQMQVNPSV